MAVAASAAAIVMNVLAPMSRSEVEPYVGFAEHMLGAAIGCSLAVLATIAAFGGRTLVMTIALGGALAQASAPLAVGLQHTASWVAFAALATLLDTAVVWLALSSPSGRPTELTARVAALAAVLMTVISIMSVVLFFDPGAWRWCTCAPNPLAVPLDGGTYLVVERSLEFGWGIVALGVLAAVGTRATRHRRTATDVALTMATVTLATAWIARAVLAITTIAGSGHVVATVEGVALLVIAIALSVRLVTLRASRGRVADLLVDLGRGSDRTVVRRQLARALGDPDLDVWWWVAGGYVDSRGAEIAPEARARVAGKGRAVLEVASAGRPVALVVHDTDLAADPALLAAVGEALQLWADNERLTDDLRATLVQVQESRVRLVSAGDDARRRIERDLHDGTQQLLVSAGLTLAAASARASEDPAVSRLLDETARQLERAVAELRELASGIAPPALAHGTLADAVEELALRSPVPTTVSASGDREPGERVRSTVYFVVAESMTNVAKHAGASSARIDLSLRDEVTVRVSDDGGGGAAAGSGSGLRGLADRVEALGGVLDIDSGPGGTTITATMPAEVPS